MAMDALGKGTLTILCSRQGRHADVEAKSRGRAAEAWHLKIKRTQPATDDGACPESRIAVLQATAAEAEAAVLFVKCRCSRALKLLDRAVARVVLVVGND